MTEYRKDIAKITSTMLGVEDHGILTVWMTVSYGGSSGQGIGGYCLDEPTHDVDGKFTGRVGTTYGMEFVARIMRACGVDKWEDLKGRTIYVLQNIPEGRSTLGTSAVVGIENLPTERGERFVFADLAAEMAVSA